MGNCSFKHEDETGVISGLRAPVLGTQHLLINDFYRACEQVQFFLQVRDWARWFRLGMEGRNAQDEIVLRTKRNVKSTNN
jgi:hypothetical protein